MSALVRSQAPAPASFSCASVVSKLGWKSGQVNDIRGYAEIISRGDKIALTPGKIRM